MIKDFENTLEDLKSMLLEGLKIENVKELSEVDKGYKEGYQTFDISLNDNLTRFVFTIEQGDTEKLSKLSHLAQEHYKPNKDMFPSTCSPAPLNIEAPFYQGMTKEETVRSMSDFVYSKKPNIVHNYKDVYSFGHILVVTYEDNSIIELSKKGDQWTVLGKNSPYYKEIIQLEGPAKKKEQERKEERFAEMEAKYLEGIKDVGYHLDWLKDMKQKNPNWYKDHVRRECMELNFGHHICQISAEKMRKEAKELLGKVDDDIINSLDKSGEDADSLNDGILAKGYKKKVRPKPKLTAQDLIQAAKDELVDRIYKHDCSSRDSKQGFAECIKFMEQILKDQPNVK